MVKSGGVASTAALDSVAEEVQLLSQFMDDVVSELPAPVDTTLISKLVRKIAESTVKGVSDKLHSQSKGFWCLCEGV